MTMIIEMNVNMDCAGCESKIRKALLKLDGVDDVDIDMGMQKVTVTGWADQMEVLKTVRKSGRRAELWPYPYNHEYHSFNNHYNTNNYYTRNLNSYHNHQDHDYDDHDEGHNKNDYYSLSSQSSNYEGDYHYQQQPATSSGVRVSRYNYREHGYNGHDHGYYLQPPHLAMFNERGTNLFSDDNPHACSIM